MESSSRTKKISQRKPNAQVFYIGDILDEVTNIMRLRSDDKFKLDIEGNVVKLTKIESLDEAFEFITNEYDDTFKGLVDR